MAKQATPVTTRSARPAARTRKTQSEVSKVQFGIPLGPRNLMLIGIGIAVIATAYLMMSTAIPEDPANNDGIWNNSMAVTLAPILLALGYLVIIPFGIFYRPKDGRAVDAENTASGI